MPNETDILENYILERYPSVLPALLLDRTTGKNIFWATDDYRERGAGYSFADPITVDAITGPNGLTIRPRALKSREEQALRAKSMAEIFTPSWLCNRMNNFADAEWFGSPDVFNKEKAPHSWTAKKGKISFPEGTAWRDYVVATRLEITCGEAPFVVSRYDTVTGAPIELPDRIGMLDRKLRVVNENCTEDNWVDAALLAFKSVYGYEWQGDSLLLAREALFMTFADYYKARFGCEPQEDLALRVAEIVSWNFWQMDGLKGVVPCSCHQEITTHKLRGGKTVTETKPCPGCDTGNNQDHNGYHCKIRQWDLSNTANNDNYNECEYCKIAADNKDDKQAPTFDF